MAPAVTPGTASGYQRLSLWWEAVTVPLPPRPALTERGGPESGQHPGQVRVRAPVPRHPATATVTSISTAPPRGSAATPMADRVWRPASPKAWTSTSLAPSITAG